VDDVERHARTDSWFRAYGGRVLAYLLHRTDPDTAQDVLQEVFVIAYRKAATVPEPPLGWLFGTARRVLANTARSARRRERLQLHFAANMPAAAAADGGSADLVRQTLAQLSAADQEVLTLSAWYQLSGDEAAQALGCSRSAYNVRLHRARRRFADALPASGYAGIALREAVHE
jgi:RNA polymerase sigma-70 factor (ECF subfamily)